MYVQHPNSVLIWLYCVLTLGVVVISEKIGSNEIGDEIELAENAENVCIDQELQTQILNTTYIQSQVRSIFRKFNRFFRHLKVCFFFVCRRFGQGENQDKGSRSCAGAFVGNFLEKIQRMLAIFSTGNCSVAR